MTNILTSVSTTHVPDSDSYLYALGPKSPFNHPNLGHFFFKSLERFLRLPDFLKSHVTDPGGGGDSRDRQDQWTDRRVDGESEILRRPNLTYS